ncbi:UNVERIFIED_CONTAM: hypothetical protein FKN15_038023 [Acipenser sinensis]
MPACSETVAEEAVTVHQKSESISLTQLETVAAGPEHTAHTAFAGSVTEATVTQKEHKQPASSAETKSEKFLAIEKLNQTACIGNLRNGPAGLVNDAVQEDQSGSITEAAGEDYRSLASSSNSDAIKLTEESERNERTKSGKFPVIEKINETACIDNLQHGNGPAGLLNDAVQEDKSGAITEAAGEDYRSLASSSNSDDVRLAEESERSESCTVEENAGDTQAFESPDQPDSVLEWLAVVESSSAEERQAACDEIFRNEEEEHSLLEAVKLLMLNTAIELYNDMQQEKDVPIFCWLLFARDSSGTPWTFLINHLNQVRFSSRLEQGYEEVYTNFSGLRRVRGDNYCAMRATLFQALVQSNEAPAWLQREDFIQLPEKLASCYDWIKQWRFTQENENGCLVELLRGHMQLLKRKWLAVVESSSAEERQAVCDEIFRNEEEEYSLLEAVKLLMLNTAIELYNDMQQEKDVPIFCWLLFARDSSDTPCTFLSNHLNQVGFSGGLEQVEMFLLGYALELTINVYRLYKFETDEFLTFYPDDHKEDF